MSLTCQDVMLTEQPTLHPNDSVSKAFKLIYEFGMRYLPVIDDNGTYLGVFTSPTLIKLLLPRALTIQLGGQETSRSLQNLNFLHIDGVDFHQQLDHIKDEKVADHLSPEKNIPIASPDTPIMEGVLLLHNYKRHVILVEGDNNKFIGVLTIKSVLKSIFATEPEFS